MEPALSPASCICVGAADPCSPTAAWCVPATAAVIEAASGPSGSNAAYLLHLVIAMRARGVHDLYLEHLWEGVLLRRAEVEEAATVAAVAEMDGLDSSLPPGSTRWEVGLAASLPTHLGGGTSGRTTALELRRQADAARPHH